MTKPIEEMTPEEIRKEIKLHKESIAAGKVGTPNIYVRVTDLERALEERTAEHIGGFSIAIALFDPHMKKMRSDMISYISPTTAKMRFAQAVDALMNRNWLIMNDKDITGSFENLTNSGQLSPTPEDLEELHEQLESKANRVYISQINQDMEELIQKYINKKYE